MTRRFTIQLVTARAQIEMMRTVGKILNGENLPDPNERPTPEQIDARSDHMQNQLEVIFEALGIR